jgi:ankyrin repeat protein
MSSSSSSFSSLFSAPKSTPELEAALCTDVKKGDNAEIDRLVAKGADITFNDLHEAVFYCQTATVEHLVVKYRLDVNAKNYSGDTALICAADRQQFAIGVNS